MNGVTDQRVERALEFLGETEEEFAASVGRKNVVDDLKKIAMSEEFLAAEGRGNNAEREAMARTSERYRKAVSDVEDAYRHESLMRARRARAEATIEVWRTQEASRRRGNV